MAIIIAAARVLIRFGHMNFPFEQRFYPCVVIGKQAPFAVRRLARRYPQPLRFVEQQLLDH